MIMMIMMMRILLLAVATTFSSASEPGAMMVEPPQYPQALAGPKQYLESEHLQQLQDIIDNALNLEDSVVALLEKYTIGAERIVRSANTLSQQQKLTPSCKLRVLKHLDNRLNLQNEQSSSAVSVIDNIIKKEGPTAKALIHLKTFSNTISSHVDEIETCLDRCDAATISSFGARGGNGGGAVAKGSIQLDCEEETKKLHNDMKKTSERIKRNILRSTSSLSESNADLSSSLSGNNLEKEREETERRNNDLMAYTETKEKHEALSKELIDVLHSRTEILESTQLARNASTIAIQKLRTTCDEIKRKRVKLLNESNTTSNVFLSKLNHQKDVYKNIVNELKNKNNIEEKYALSLSAEVDLIASKCMKSMETVTSRIVMQKRVEHRPADDDSIAIGSIMSGKATKKDENGVDKSIDVNEIGSEWSKNVYSTERQRGLDHGKKASEIPLLLVEEHSVLKKNKLFKLRRQKGNDDDEVEELKKQALLIDQKLEKAENAGRVGNKLPSDLVGNAEATSETFWKDINGINNDDVANATPQEEKLVGHLVQEVSQMDDDLVTPKNEIKVPLEYSKLSEELGELRGEGEIF